MIEKREQPVFDVRAALLMIRNVCYEERSKGTKQILEIVEACLTRLDASPLTLRRKANPPDRSAGQIEAFLYDGDRLVEQRIIPALVQEIRKPIFVAEPTKLFEVPDTEPSPVHHEVAVFVLAHRHGSRRGGNVRAEYRRQPTDGHAKR